MNVLKSWKHVYRHPREVFSSISDKGPQFGFKAYLIRGILTSILFYIPLVLMGRTPEMPSFITLWPTEQYYLIMTITYPFITIGVWLMNGALVHLILHSLSKKNDIDKLLNVSGVANIATFPFLLIFDWSTLLLFGGLNSYLLGISHIFIDGYFLYLLIIGYEENLDLNWKLSTLLFILQMVVSISVAALLLRG